MKLSSKGKYGITIMIYLAKHYKEDRYISLKEISENENISLKYLEKLMISLNKDNSLEVKKGNNGGYKLKDQPNTYKIGDILRKLEGGDITNCEEKRCDKKDKCVTYSIYKELNDEFNKMMDNKTLNDYL